MNSNAKILGKENVEYRLFDKDGNTKKIFQENKLFTWLMKKGILSPHASKIPFILGHWSDKKVIANLVTDAGFAAVAGQINGVGSVAAFTYIELGTGTTAADHADTAVETPISDSGLQRAAATCTLVTTTIANDTAQLLKSFSVTGAKAITESGVLNDATTGTLLARQVFAAVNVVNTDTFQMTWKFKVATA